MKYELGWKLRLGLGLSNLEFFQTIFFLFSFFFGLERGRPSCPIETVSFFGRSFDEFSMFEEALT